MASMKDTIKSVAVDLFFRKGYYATSISDIARGCGIQKASIYYHFPGKEELLFSIMQSTMQDLLSSLENHLADASDIEGRMRAAIRSHVSFHLNRQKETFIATSELRGLTEDHLSVIVARRDDYERIFQELIRQGVDQGVYENCDMKILSYAILTLCTAGAFWFRPDGRLSVDEIADIYEKFVLNGLMAAQASRAFQQSPAEFATRT
ncbi:MAG: TetR/AcrR family transcriptional regulator [Desulfobacteraceae bacterium]|nr:MAG: TetR/AcrR family transcriptional regulator [Desulfobacteraceae bacterium]